MHLSLGLIVQPLSVHSAQIQQPCAFYVEAKVSYRGYAYFFWFDKQIPKNVVAFSSATEHANVQGGLLFGRRVHLEHLAQATPTGFQLQ
jgi:hypothetical protein